MGHQISSRYLFQATIHITFCNFPEERKRIHENFREVLNQRNYSDPYFVPRFLSYSDKYDLNAYNPKKAGKNLLFALAVSTSDHPDIYAADKNESHSHFAYFRI
jgi:hypothetical protein